MEGGNSNLKKNMRQYSDNTKGFFFDAAINMNLKVTVENKALREHTALLMCELL